MLKPCTIVALLATTASAQAGHAISMRFDDANVRISMPGDCAQLACMSVSIGGPQSDEASIESSVKSADPSLRARAPVLSGIPTEARRDASSQATPVAVGSTAVAPAAIDNRSTRIIPNDSIAARTNARSAEGSMAAVSIPRRPAYPSPLGVWRTERQEGEVHIVFCGDNLCGYVFNPVNGQDGEKVVIEMRPSGPTEWRGKIRDPRGYGTYSSTITISSADRLAVRGCAFGGMICGSQTWSRV